MLIIGAQSWSPLICSFLPLKGLGFGLEAGESSGTLCNRIGSVLTICGEEGRSCTGCGETGRPWSAEVSRSMSKLESGDALNVWELVSRQKNRVGGSAQWFSGWQGYEAKPRDSVCSGRRSRERERGEGDEMSSRRGSCEEGGKAKAGKKRTVCASLVSVGGS